MTKIEPIQPRFNIEVLSSDQLSEFKAATLEILEQVGVQFPSERALDLLAAHGADVDRDSQIVRLPPDLVLRAMSSAPRSYTLAGRDAGTDLYLDGTRSYFTTDGCGVHTIDLQTGEQRPSRKEDVAMMARVADHLSSIAIYWPMVSAQDFGELAPLHEIDASFNNTVKHVQTETVMGEVPARYAVRMAEVIAGDSARMRSHPPLSAMVCTIAPLGQDKEGIEGAMVFAEAGIPIGFMSMPNMGATAPATVGGALVVATAEIISALVLMQLVAPGAPGFYSIVSSIMDPRSAEYINTLPGKYVSHLAGVQIAHDWGIPILGGAFGTQYAQPDTWELGRDSVYNSLLVPLAGADFVVGMGELKASTILWPEQLLYDDEIYHTNRILAEGINVTADELALDVIAGVGPRGHFMAQIHTRHHLRQIWLPDLSHPRPAVDGRPLPGKKERARVRLERILAEHRPAPLDERARSELEAILTAAQRELKRPS